MKTTGVIQDIREFVKKQKMAGKTVGFVPTMGALHEGHASLIRESAKNCDVTVVSIFVNPIQFGPNEDLDSYPRTLEADARLADSCGADLLYTPSKVDILGKNLLTYVNIRELEDNLCGKKRPGHFEGVCTIVTKLFNIVDPDKAFFGKKDIQQLYILKKMSEDLNFDIELVGCPIIRETDGLAMSSRNTYLNEQERKDSLILYETIVEAKMMIDNGEKKASAIIDKIEKMIKNVASARIDYISLVNEVMKDVESVEPGNVLALAVFIGKTRLIDNYIIGDDLEKCY